MRIGISWLDFKLGFRMLVKYPGLTLVGALAIAFAIWMGAGAFEFISQVVRPTLPLPDGDRIVGVRVRDAESSRLLEPRLDNFERWRHELRTLDELGAYRTRGRNLITGEGLGEPLRIAEISPAGFRVARVAPLLGRGLVEADGQSGATAVAVIGHDVWQRRFGGDSGVVGRTVQLGNEQTTIVGVMPEGFGFPVAHSVWVPLRLNALDFAPEGMQMLAVFGRLAPGASLEDAQAELAAWGRRAAADHPDTHRHLRPRVLPYAKSVVYLPNIAALGFSAMNLFLVMLLLLVTSNVALLMFARAAAREGELAVRTALGATRGRIITQLFAEALVLAGLGAVLGLAASRWGLRWMQGVIEADVAGGGLFNGMLPFWFRPGLSPATVLYSVGLTILAATVIGVVPGLKVTRGLRARLQRASAGGGGFRFGGVWTAVIVAQVAMTVTFPAAAYIAQSEARQIHEIRIPFSAHEFLTARLEMDREHAAETLAEIRAEQRAERFTAAFRDLEQRLLADPAVTGVTYGERLPLMYHPHRLIEIDEGGAAPLHPSWPEGYRVSSAAVDPDFFEVLNTPIVTGRGFGSGDLAGGARSIVVNQSFVERVLGGRNPIGRRVRYVFLEERRGDPSWSPEDEPWYEIVGVVPDMGTSAGDEDPKIAAFYHPASPGDVAPLQLAVHLRGDPTAFPPRLRALAAAVDPDLRLYDPMPLSEVTSSDLLLIAFWFWLIIGVSVVALVLSLAGIYSVMAFTVAQRTREIGIRVALGAPARSILGGIFRRPLRQLALGIGVGGLFAGALVSAAESTGPTAAGAAMFLGYVVLMTGVCLLACFVPTRRALGVEPTEALRAE